MHICRCFRGESLHLFHAFKCLCVPDALAWSNAHSAWQADGCGFDPHARHILSWRFGHEKNSTTILSRPLIQEGQLSVTGDRMCTKYW